MLKFLENDKKCLYIIRPLCNNIFDSLDNNNELISIPDTYFKNISIKVPYLHIKKYKESRSREQNLYNLTIFSSIQSENIYTSPEETIHNKLCYQDKTWYILKKKKIAEENKNTLIIERFLIKFHLIDNEVVLCRRYIL